jgi:hypothetical protein
MAKWRKSPSWVAIIIGFIFFPPVGVFLFIKRITTDRGAAVRKHRAAPFMSWMLVFIGVFLILPLIKLGLRGGFWEICGLIFLISGIASARTARKGEQEGSRFRGYIDAIVNQGMVSFQDIAVYMGTSVAEVRRDLKKMVQMGYFDQAYIDENRDEIHLFHRRAEYRAGGARPGGEYRQESAGKPDDGPSAEGSGQGKSGDVETMGTCRNCGAHNWLEPGVRNVCEFCGSPIVA